MDFDERMHQELEQFHNLLNGGEKPCSLKETLLQKTRLLKDKICEQQHELNVYLEENEKEENCIDKVNYLMEEISNISRKTDLKVETIKKLQHIKSSLETQLNESIPLNRNLCLGAKHYNDEHFFDISMVTEEADDNIYLVKMFFSENQSVIFQYNIDKNSFELQSTSPIIDNFEEAKDKVQQTNDMAGFLYHFRKYLR